MAQQHDSDLDSDTKLKRMEIQCTEHFLLFYLKVATNRIGSTQQNGNFLSTHTFQ